MIGLWISWEEQLEDQSILFVDQQLGGTEQLIALNLKSNKNGKRNRRERTSSPGMLRSFLFSGFAALLLLLLVPITCRAKPNYKACHSSCGNIHDIRGPFRLKDDPLSCGDSEYELACENNRTILHLNSRKYYVEEINYKHETIRVVDTALRKDDCSSLLLHSLNDENFGDEDLYVLLDEYTAINFIDCEAPISSPFYVDMPFCSKNSSSNFSLSSIQTYSYVVVGDMKVSDLRDSCSIARVVRISSRGPKIDKSSLSSIQDGLLYGTDLIWGEWCWLPLCPKPAEILVSKIFLHIKNEIPSFI